MTATPRWIRNAQSSSRACAVAAAALTSRTSASSASKRAAHAVASVADGLSATPAKGPKPVHATRGIVRARLSSRAVGAALRRGVLLMRRGGAAVRRVAIVWGRVGLVFGARGGSAVEFGVCEPAHG